MSNNYFLIVTNPLYAVRCFFKYYREEVFKEVALGRFVKPGA